MPPPRGTGIRVTTSVQPSSPSHTRGAPENKGTGAVNAADANRSSLARYRRVVMRTKSVGHCPGLHRSVYGEDVHAGAQSDRWTRG